MDLSCFLKNIPDELYRKIYQYLYLGVSIDEINSAINSKKVLSKLREIQVYGSLTRGYHLTVYRMFYYSIHQRIDFGYEYGKNGLVNYKRKHEWIEISPFSEPADCNH